MGPTVGLAASTDTTVLQDAGRRPHINAHRPPPPQRPAGHVQHLGPADPAQEAAEMTLDAPTEETSTPAPSPIETETQTPAETQRQTSTVPPSAPLAPVAAAAPAGSAAPQGNQAGWRQVFVDNFDGNSLGSDWRTYSGQPGGSPYGRWDPSHVNVSNGALVLSNDQQGGQWTSGGLAHRLGQTYGKWEMRFRIDRSDEIKYALLLWPDSDRWPADGEIDFAEDAGGDRSGTTSTLHFGADNQMINDRVNADFTQWHTVGVEWSPSQVVYTLDGQPWKTTSNNGVPTGPMHLAIQTQPGGCQGSHDAFGCGSGTPASASMQVDWVAVYARN